MLDTIKVTSHREVLWAVYTGDLNVTFFRAAKIERLNRNSARLQVSKVLTP